MSTEKYFSAAEKMVPIFATKKPYGQGPRLGTLNLPGKNPIKTPHFLALTSRGLIPHITQDNLKAHLNVRSMHVSLEDFVEKIPQALPPVYCQNVKGKQSAIKRFLALPEDLIVIFGARNILPVTATSSNTDQAISICTSVGFRWLSTTEYLHAVEKLRPDIVIGLTDVTNTNPPSRKRLEKAVSRTIRWTIQLFADAPCLNGSDDTPKVCIFAPVLPLSYDKQYEQFEVLRENLGTALAGLALSEGKTIGILPSEFLPLPRLLSSTYADPSELLQEIEIGADIITIPFIGKATDAGVALTFTFPAEASNSSQNRLATGIDLWQEQYATQISPIQDGCRCYTCQRHHKAYIHHLLSAKEMLAWVLLQIHNHWVMDQFFKGVRFSIQNESFRSEREKFDSVYQRGIPHGSGLGPRIRGYHVKTGPNQPKRNAAPFARIVSNTYKLQDQRSDRK